MKEARRRWLQGLFGKYVLSFVGLTLLLLVVNGGLETWFIYRETTQLLAKTLSEKAEATTRRIEESIFEIERQISWATRASATTIEQRREDYALLLRQVPAVDRVIQLDATGKEELRLTRANVVVGSGIDYSSDPRFTELRTRSTWLSSVYFDGPDPAVTIAIRHSGRNADSTVAEINLRFLSNFIDADQIGRNNEAYVVEPSGRLLAHSNGSRLGVDFSHLPQVASMTNAGRSLKFGNDPGARAVLSGAAVVPRLQWVVLFEQPLSTALQPVYSLLLRTGGLLVVGVVLAVVIGMLMARHMVVPIRALQVGAQQLEASDFGHRIQVRTADEIEDLAQHFNRMADQLQESYTRLEQKVAERTRELEQSVSELKALEEIGRADA
jgi:HAMP domain-containing protein